ncbi:MAG: hypothetical protein ACK4YQ_12825 [Phenylobacterium sp.]|uniref:hypothetical protein n=1 Tax=Phenylobacterium sp. TaxID=1871053 RepID=UPI00391A0937
MSEVSPAAASATARTVRPSVQPRVALAAALAAATALAAGLGAWAVARPLGGLAAVSPLAGVHDARAAAHMKAILGSEDLDEAEREARMTLAQSPAQASAWVRLAYVETWRHRRVTPEALRNISRSYKVSPLGPDVSRARVKFALEAWPELPRALQDQALVELETMRWRKPEEAGRLVQGIVDLQGRLVGGMALADADAKAALRRTR